MPKTRSSAARCSIVKDKEIDSLAVVEKEAKRQSKKPALVTSLESGHTNKTLNRNQNKNRNNHLKTSMKESSSNFAFARSNDDNDDDYQPSSSDDEGRRHYLKSESEESYTSESDNDSLIIHNSKKTASHKVDFQGDVESSDEDGMDNDNRESRSSSDDDDDESVERFCLPCDSKYDAVTNQRLNAEHVCWCPNNDDSNKQCFAVETLYRISKSMNKKHWLQPPHFRSKMDNDLINQIKAKFGENVANTFTNLQNMHRLILSGDAQEQFEQALNSYMYKFLGSNDLYVCPICYTYGIHNLANIEEEIINRHGLNDSHDDDSFDSNLGRNKRVKINRFSWLDSIDINNADPMDTLSRFGSNDGELDIAATCCYRKISGMKAHLKSTHKVDISALEGNDLFQRYRIRGTDGLLQHFVYRDGFRNVGVLQAYWNYGNAAIFLHLLFLVDHLECIDPEAHLFCAGIGSKTAEKIWQHVSGPYEKVQDDDYDFIDERNESDISENEESSDPSKSSPSDNDNESIDPEVEFIRMLRQMRGKHSDDDSSGSDSSSTEDNAKQKEEDEELPPDYVYEESEEEEDEWLLEKRMRKRQSSLSPKVDSFDNKRENRIQNIDKLSYDSDFEKNGISSLASSNGKYQKVVIKQEDTSSSSDKSEIDSKRQNHSLSYLRSDKKKIIKQENLTSSSDESDFGKIRSINRKDRNKFLAPQQNETYNRNHGQKRSRLRNFSGKKIVTAFEDISANGKEKSFTPKNPGKRIAILDDSDEE